MKPISCTLLSALKSRIQVKQIARGGCPRIAIVARASPIESDFSIIWGEYLLYLTKMIEKYGQSGLSAVDQSVLGQPPSRFAFGGDRNWVLILLQKVYLWMIVMKEKTLEEIREAMTQAWVLGDDRFKDKI